MSEKTKKLRFNFDARVDGKVIYERGKEYDVPVKGGSADRWIRRGAVEIEAEEVVKAKPVKGKEKVKEQAPKKEEVKKEEVKKAKKEEDKKSEDELL